MKPLNLLSLSAFCALNSVAMAQTKPAATKPAAAPLPSVPATRTTESDANRKAAASTQSMRRLMSAAGLTEIPTQNAVIEYIAARDKMRAELLPLARAAAASLLKPDVPAIPQGDELLGDEAVTEAFGAYRNAMEGAHVQEAEELEKLDALVAFSSTPRVEAFLTLIGVLSDDVLPLGGADAVFAPLEVAAAAPAK